MLPVSLILNAPRHAVTEVDMMQIFLLRFMTFNIVMLYYNKPNSDFNIQ